MEGWDVFRDAGGAVVADRRYAPLFIVTWFDEPGEAAIREFFRWNEKVVSRAKETGGYVLVTDSTQAKRPKPVERRLISELTAAMPEISTELNVGNYVVLDNALIRGALTAMQWLGSSPWKIETVATCREALIRGMEDLARAGLPIPSSLEPGRYERPSRPD